MSEFQKEEQRRGRTLMNVSKCSLQPCGVTSNKVLNSHNSTSSVSFAFIQRPLAAETLFGFRLGQTGRAEMKLLRRPLIPHGGKTRTQTHQNDGGQAPC